jgi:hypothetical protein
LNFTAKKHWAQFRAESARGWEVGFAKAKLRQTKNLAKEGNENALEHQARSVHKPLRH